MMVVKLTFHGNQLKLGISPYSSICQVSESELVYLNYSEVLLWIAHIHWPGLHIALCSSELDGV